MNMKAAKKFAAGNKRVQRVSKPNNRAHQMKCSYYLRDLSSNCTPFLLAERVTSKTLEKYFQRMGINLGHQHILYMVIIAINIDLSIIKF